MTATTTPGLDRRLRAFRDDHGLPALGAAVLEVDRDPVTVVTGVRVRGGRDEATVDDRWHIGSCAKAVTAALVAILVQRGQITWDTALADLFPDVTGHPGWREVTLADLLTHVSGVPANPDRAQLIAGQTDPAPPGEQRTALARRVLAAAPDHPGRFRYSNIGYTLAGAAVERLTGLSFEDALRRDVLDPLGMASAGFGPPTGDDQPRGHRPRWIALGRGPAVDPATRDPRQPADNPPVLTPAGRLHLSLGDWARFVALFLDRPPTLLSGDSCERITTAPPGRPQAMGWAVPGGRHAARAGLVQVGANLRWVAAAAISPDRRRAALVVTNDGRPRIIRRLGPYAADLLG
jgi:CubicO group peptidase (beta-lactamase class C family)